MSLRTAIRGRVRRWRFNRLSEAEQAGMSRVLNRGVVVTGHHRSREQRVKPLMDCDATDCQQGVKYTLRRARRLTRKKRALAAEQQEAIARLLGEVAGELDDGEKVGEWALRWMKPAVALLMRLEEVCAARPPRVRPPRQTQGIVGYER